VTDENSQREEEFASLVAACDDALAAGSALVDLNSDVPTELRQRLERGIACMKLLRQALPQDLLPPPPTNSPLTHLGRFQLRRELGQGAFGIVWLAHDPQLRRDVALKVPRLEALVSPAARERFLREARAAAGLDHPNVVPVYEAGEIGSVCYIASAYCPGSTLAHWLKQRNESVPTREAALLVATLAEAVEHAHRRGVVHRDLKPSNVLLETLADPAGTGLGYVPRITDFGLAKLQAEGEGVQTQSGAIVGTPAYMAPEQAGGHSKEVGPAADVYALGAILYELLTGRPPFLAETVLDILVQVRAAEPVPPGQLRGKLPRDLETICLKCLQKDPARRYGSAQELAEDLRRFLAGEPIQARPVGRLERLWRWCRRHPAPAAIVVLAAVLVVGLPTTFAISEALNAGRLREEKKNTEGALAASEREAAQLALTQGLHLCEQGETGRGLLLMTRSLEHATKGEDLALEQAIRLTLAGWSREVNPLVQVLPQQTSAVGAASSPDGKTIVTRDGNTARLWDAVAGLQLGLPLEHETFVLGVAFSRDGKIVLTWAADNTARLWDAATGKSLGLLLPNKQEGQTGAIAPDGKTFAAADFLGLRQWRDGDPPLGLFLRLNIGLVANSRDGQLLLTSNGAVVRLCQAATGKQIGADMGPHGGGRIWAAALSPDGKLVLTGGADETARLWDASTGRPIGQPLQHQGAVNSVCFSPGGEIALTGSPDVCRLWSVTKDGLAELPRRLSGGWPGAFSLDGKLVLTRHENAGARLWEVATGRTIGQPMLGANEFWSFTLGSDGKTILMSCRDKAVRIWEFARGQAIGSPLLHDDEVVAVAFSPDGKRLLTAGGFKGTSTVPIPPGTPPLGAVATGGLPGPRGGISPPVPGEGDAERLIRIDPRILGPGRPRFVAAIRLWETATGRPLGQPFQHAGGLAFAVFSPDGEKILAGGGLNGGGNTARLWDVATGKVIGAPLEHADYVNGGVFSPDGKTVLTGSGQNERGECRLWDAATGKPRGAPLPHVFQVRQVAFSRDGKLILAAGGRAVRLWETATGQSFGPLLEQQGAVQAIAFSPDCRTVLTGSQNGSAQLWDVTTGKPLGSPMRHQHFVGAVALSPDGKSVLTGSDDYTARLWDAATGRPLGPPPLRHQKEVRALAFSPDNQVLLTGSLDGTCRLWAAATCQPLGPPLRHPGGQVQIAAFSPDGKTVLTGGGDERTARLWAVPAPVSGTQERITLWAQVLTGLELDPYGDFQTLDVDTWRQRRQRLTEMGGPPLP
jgi:WD40 repeat protein